MKTIQLKRLFYFPWVVKKYSQLNGLINVFTYGSSDIIIHGSDCLIALIAAYQLAKHGYTVLLNPIALQEHREQSRSEVYNEGHASIIKEYLKIEADSYESCVDRLLQLIDQPFIKERISILGNSYLLPLEFRKKGVSKKLTGLYDQILSPCFGQYKSIKLELPIIWDRVFCTLPNVYFDPKVACYFQRVFSIQDGALVQKSKIKRILSHFFTLKVQCYMTKKHIVITKSAQKGKNTVEIGQGQFFAEGAEKKDYYRGSDIFAAINICKLVEDQQYYKKYLETFPKSAHFQ